MSEYFFIKSDLNGLVLDVEEACKLPGTYVSPWKKNDTDAQKWRIDARTGTIRNALTGFCIDLECGGRLVVNPYQEGKINQQWERKGKAIANRIEGKMVLDIADADPKPRAKVRALTENSTPAQSWTFEHAVHAELPYYFIKSDLSGLVLDVEEAYELPGTYVSPWKKNDSDAQKWLIDAQTGTIRSKLTGFCMDLECGGRLVVNPYQEGKINQQWVQKDKEIVNRIVGKMVLDVADGNVKPRAKVRAYLRNSTPAQSWTFEMAT